MNGRSDDPDPVSAESLFARWTDQSRRGEAPEFEALCASHPEHADELRRRLATLHADSEEDPSATRDRFATKTVRQARRPPSAGSDRPVLVSPAQHSDALLSRLADHAVSAPSPPRYRVKGEIAHGGMGTILEVFDEDLERTLAMKVLLEREGPDSRIRGGGGGGERRDLVRFLEEAQVTGQLDHPGVVPVHELGLDSKGRVFFTMKLVRGRDLRTIFGDVFEGRGGWNETRALAAILKVCEALAFAHAKGVIHRDLKPANVMVGDFGEVYVMDWGLARVLGRKDTRDLRPRRESATSASIRTERREEREETPDSPLFTMDGHVVGTPAYMPPEQARGETDLLGPRSDVYAVGAMLYHLLARQMPYVPPNSRLTSRTVLARVVEGPPEPLHSLRRDLPGELTAIVDKAMARENSSRYANTSELASDLRAYLEHRVVKAYATGPVAELRKWVERNKGFAATIAAAALALVAALVAVNDARLEASENVRLALLSGRRAADQKELAELNASRAAAAAAEARKEKEEVLRLSDLQRLTDLEREADRLWPAAPDKVGPLEAWLARARELVGRLSSHRARLEEFRSRALPWDDEQRAADRETHPKSRELADLRRRILEADERLLALEADPEADDAEVDRLRTFLARAESDASLLDAEVAERRTWRFSNTEIQWQEGLVAKLVAGIESIAREDRGYASVTIPSIERRLDFARTVFRATIDDAREAWDAAIADVRASERYGGLRLVPQLGLVPLRKDPASGLWEFWHVPSGERPAIGDDGRIVPAEGMGLVMVLVPGGTFAMGSPETEAGRQPDEMRHEVALAPYFISKYEMTQAQWERFTGENPSHYKPPSAVGRDRLTTLHPVERMSWNDCKKTLGRLGLDLPTEAQWEHAARGGTTTAWWPGDEREAIRGIVNIADRTARDAGATWPVLAEWPDNDDGHATHAPVGSYPPNAFGLHETLGNVWEWCRDYYADYDLPSAPVDGERRTEPTERRVFRGGSFGAPASFARAAVRDSSPPEGKDGNLGVRPARAVDPE